MAGLPGAASANALNQVYEVATDRLMRRTAAAAAPWGAWAEATPWPLRAAATGLAGVGLLAELRPTA